MKPPGFIGLVLIVVGIIVLAYGWFGSMTYSTKENVAKLGPVEINKQNEHRVPLGPIIGGVTLAGGIVLVIVGSQKA